ncbi:hypothetical protein VCUG_01054 [Vavraia culicis subsp. floridensis]|uniref:Uncharacterized protein n=1 Tax=Vavraia culicis (isolate floridensis) TaxID=948595 RepID=L2GVV5_VAVCU|nr:uncharacterized protein VCUG_01054 [Vavraia culicis subsp. floridensis]ELA47403.1 hypothetical protein VCUG_01054 [Vavraia culicis subsp. floridensis]
MKKYLLNYLNIVHNHVDTADYDVFADECIKYIGNHRKYILLVLKSLSEFKDDNLLCMSYKIIREVNSDQSIDVCDEVLQKHIQNTNLKDSVILYLATTNKNICKVDIMETFYDKYEFNIEYCLIFNNSCYKDDFIDFLESQRPEFVERKLYAMIYTCRFYNVWEYVEDFGSEDKFRSLLVCNLFNLLVEKVQQAMNQLEGDSCKRKIQSFFRNEFCIKDAFCYRCEKFILCISKTSFFIDMVGNTRLNVQSINNFFVNFKKFMRKKDMVDEWIRDGNRERVRSALSGYVSNDEGFTLPDEVNFREAGEPRQIFVAEKETEINFDHLFDNNCLKLPADCTEP